MTEWYPVVIRESRYKGAYSNGKFIIVCGAVNPTKLNAFGSDTDCRMFWKNHNDKDSPLTKIGTAFGERDVYIDSGDNPGGLYKDFLEYKQNNS